MRDILTQLSLGPKTLEEILQETGGVRSLAVTALNTLVAQKDVALDTATGKYSLVTTPIAA